MKRNIIVEGLINFLIPVVGIYTIFLIVRFADEGLFAILYSLLLLLTFAIIYFVSLKEIYKIKLVFSLRIILWFFFFAAFFYLISVFVLLIS